MRRTSTTARHQSGGGVFAGDIGVGFKKFDCGGKAVGEVWVDDSRVLRAFIRCQKCGCKTKTMEQMPFESKEDVIKAAIGLWCYRVGAIKQEGWKSMDIEDLKHKIIERSKGLSDGRGAEERIESFIREALINSDLGNDQIEALLNALNLHPIKQEGVEE